jgi:hypothetical protein
VLHVPDLGLVVAGDVIYNGVHQYLGESANVDRDAWRKAIDSVNALRPRWVVAGRKNKELDDAAARVIAETRQYLNDADDLLEKNSTARDFFAAVLQSYPNRRLGATTFWAGTSILSTHCVIAMTERFFRRVLQAGFDCWSGPCCASRPK